MIPGQDSRRCGTPRHHAERKAARIMMRSTVTILLVLASVLSYGPAHAVDTPPRPAGLVSGQVVNVVDGDTVDVSLGGKTERLRLIGLDTPETKDPRKPVQCFGREASAHAKALLNGRTVGLETDATQDTRDRYGRLLAYVWVGARLYNLDMIADGYAHEYTYRVPYKYQTLFKQAQQEASAAGRGLWSPATCNGDTEQAAGSQTQPQQAQRCFPETGHCIAGRFRQYWEQNGGLPVFGYPIGPAQDELNRDTGQTYLTQWFERNRFELHPENSAPYDVLLGRLGDDRLRQLGSDWQTFGKGQQTAGCLWFAETGHSVCPPFRGYWETHGLRDPALSAYARSLALFGLPLSERVMETNTSGDTVETQWFERARFECHPNNPPEYRVLLGLLGNEVRTSPVIPNPKPAITCVVTAAPPPPPPPPPPARPQPTPVPPPSRNCDPSYPTVCIPSPPPDLDCGDIPHRRFRVLQPDPHRFDRDRNGIGCESG